MKEFIILKPKAITRPVGTKIPVIYEERIDHFVEDPLRKGHLVWMPF